MSENNRGWGRSLNLKRERAERFGPVVVFRFFAETPTTRGRGFEPIERLDSRCFRRLVRIFERRAQRPLQRGFEDCFLFERNFLRIRRNKKRGSASRD